MRLSIIVAVADNGVIGRDNSLPWRLSADLKRFKELTMGHHLLLGRKSFDSVGRPLPGRTMVVISRGKPSLPEGVLLAHSLDEAIAIARAAGDGEAFVGGGGEIYRLALPLAERIYLTRVHADFDGDTKFPDYDESEWSLLAREELPSDEANSPDHSFLILDRRAEAKGEGARTPAAKRPVRN